MYIFKQSEFDKACVGKQISKIACLASKLS